MKASRRTQEETPMEMDGMVQVLFDLKVEQERFIINVWFQESILQLHS